MALYVVTGQAFWCKWVLTPPWLVSITFSGHHQAQHCHHWQHTYLWKGVGAIALSSRGSSVAELLVINRNCYLIQQWRCGLASSIWLAGHNPGSKKDKSINSLPSPPDSSWNFYSSQWWIYYWLHFIFSRRSTIVFNFWFLLGEVVRLAIIIASISFLECFDVKDWS